MCREVVKHRAVVGLGFGDESKGSTVDYLCSLGDVSAVVLFNSGPQAAHNVVLSDGRHHTFSQYGSGAFRGVPTVLSRFKTVDPIGFMREREHLYSLGVGWPAIKPVVDGECLLTTPWHMGVNRNREAKRTKRHGSCGLGHGETIR
jgi:adenylosuccinate synthase